MNNIYCQGDNVYYWILRDSGNECHGPAIIIGKDGQQVLVKRGGVYVRIHTCRLQLCNSQCNIFQQSLPEPRAENDDHVNTNNETSDEDDSDEYEQATGKRNDWIHDTNKKDLPSVNSVVICKFPDCELLDKCKVLSKAGKSKTGNWHFMNVQDGEQFGKCCSFKNACLKSTQCDQYRETTETFYSDCLNNNFPT